MSIAVPGNRGWTSKRRAVGDIRVRVAEVAVLGQGARSVATIERQLTGDHEDLVATGQPLLRCGTAPARRDAHEPAGPPVFGVFPDVDGVVTGLLSGVRADGSPRLRAGVDVEAVHGSLAGQHAGAEVASPVPSARLGLEARAGGVRTVHEQSHRPLGALRRRVGPERGVVEVGRRGESRPAVEVEAAAEEEHLLVVRMPFEFVRGSDRAAKPFGPPQQHRAGRSGVDSTGPLGDGPVPPLTVSGQPRGPRGYVGDGLRWTGGVLHDGLLFAGGRADARSLPAPTPRFGSPEQKGRHFSRICRQDCLIALTRSCAIDYPRPINAAIA